MSSDRLRTGWARWPSSALAVAGVLLSVVALPGQAVAADAVVEAETMALTQGTGATVKDRRASAGRALLIWSDGAATTSVTSPAGQLVVRARGDQCDGAPTMVVSVDGTVRSTVDVTSTSWRDYAVPDPVTAGARRITVAYRGDHRTALCDRNLLVDTLSVRAWTPHREAEAMSLTKGAGQVVTDSTASAGAGLLVWSNGTATTALSAPSGGTLVVRAMGEPCAGAPQLRVAVDGALVATVPVEGTAWHDVQLPGTWPGGQRRVDTTYVNDFGNGECDRNVRLDWAAVRPASPVTTPPAAEPAPAPVWAEEFGDPIDLSSPDRTGRWRANDVWQPVDRGYADFGAGGSTWNLNPYESLGGAPRTAFSQADGTMTIAARRTPAAWAPDIAARNGGTAPPWSGGLLMTDTRRPTERFGYGYFEFRARLPLPGKGMFPALWLFAANGHNPGKENAEIDLLEVFGQPTGDPWSITLHHKQLGGTAAAGATTSSGQVAVATVPSSTTDWHTYGLDWQPDHLRFYRDDVLVAEVTGAAAQFYNGVTMGLRLNYAADAAWFPQDRLSDSSTPDRLAMDVDWVRVWAAKP